MTEGILSAIQDKLPALSKGQKRIAAYILEFPEKAAVQTAAALGKAVQVSESTVVRFAAELGCDGYPALQRALQDTVLGGLTAARRMEVGFHGAGEELLDRVLQADGERLRKTAQELDRAAFAGSVEALLRARRIYVLGLRSSEALAVFACHYFHYLFDDVRRITSDSGSGVLEQLVNIKAGDVLLTISFPRYSRIALQATEFAHEAGAATVVLTDRPTAPPAPWADFLLAAPSDMISLVDSLTAPLSVLNALIAGAAARKAGETARLFDKLEEIWDIYHVYEKVDQ